MGVQAFTHKLGRIEAVDREDLPGLSRDVPLDLSAIQAAWPEFEHAFDSLQGRHMFGLVYDREQIYRLSTTRLDRDADNPLKLHETIIPGGRYLRLRLTGAPLDIYGKIGAAFDVLFEHAEHDPARPLVEYYRREGQVDCLVPIR